MTVAQPSPSRAIALKLLYLLQITVLLAVIKSIEGLPVFELMFFRLLFATLAIALVMALRGRFLESVRTRRPLAHLTRSLLAMANMGLTFVSVRLLPLPEAMTLQYTQPLFVVALSALLLSAPVGKFRWAAVAVGFVGVLIITWPNLSLLGAGVDALSHDEILGAAAALGAAATIALTLLWVAELVRTEKSTTVALWMGIYGCLMLACTMPLGWTVPSWSQMALLLVAGLMGAGAQLALTECLRAAPAATTAPFEYSSLIFAMALGFFVFGDVPDINTLAGSALLILAGLVVFWRESRLKVRAAAARMPTVAP